MQKESIKLPMLLIILLSLLLFFVGYWKLASLLILFALFLLWRTDSLVTLYLPKKVLFILLVLLLFVFTYYHSIAPKRRSSSTSGKASVPMRQEDSANFPYKVVQADVTTAIYTVAIPDTSLRRVEAHIAPMLNISNPTGEESPFITDFEIRDIAVQGNSLGTIVRVAPPHISNSLGCYGWYLQDCHTSESVGRLGDAGNTIHYNVVVTPEFLDEVPRTPPVVPQFVVVITDLGTIDHQAIMKRDGKYVSTKVAEYAGLDLSKLGSELTFNIYMRLENGDSALIPISIPLVWK